MVVWKHNSGFFSSKDCYKYIEGLDNTWEGNRREIWKLKVPPKIQIFLWKLENEVLPSHSFLKDRLHINIDIICKNCKVGQETADHIYKDCKITVKFWNEVAH